MADEGRSSCTHNSNSSSEDKDNFGNKFANDGSFMEMFRKKMQAEQYGKPTDQEDSKDKTTDNIDSLTLCDSDTASGAVACRASETVNKSCKTTLPIPMVGKRRGAAPVLKTGAVKKSKKEEQNEAPQKDAWSQYLAEVKKYKEQSCQEENKTRPLVK